MGERNNLETGAEAKKAAAIIWDKWFSGPGQSSKTDVEEAIQTAIAEATTALVAERNGALLTIRLDSYRDYDENAFAAFQNRRYLAKLIGKMLDFSNEDLNKISDISVEDHFEEGLRDGAQYLRAFVKQVVQERDEARTAARELFAELAYTNAHMPRQQGGHARREELLTKYAALLAEPEQKPNK